MGKEVTITKRKFNEVADPASSLSLYASSNKDNLGAKVMFSNGMKYRLDYGQIQSHEYQNNNLKKTL